MDRWSALFANMRHFVTATFCKYASLRDSNVRNEVATFFKISHSRFFSFEEKY